MPASPEQREHAVERASRIFAVIRDAADRNQRCPSNAVLAERFGVGTTVIVNHHQNKQGGFRGSTAIRAAFDLEWAFTRLDDEDGVRFGLLRPGSTGTAVVTVQGGGGFLNAWLDLDGNGTADLEIQFSDMVIE